ncbi:MAG: helix-turn-helix domain-containing protein [Clostridiales Family XIII bacterium]|jgi:AraC-like DNA-binding protein|nr:helix-turn-helix domain-containing protein [Clostridiales Family XIII bacterium]
MNNLYIEDNDFRIYQPFFKNHTLGFEQKMVYFPTQIRFYHFFMPETYLDKTVFNGVPHGCVDTIFIYNDTDYFVEVLGTPKHRKVLASHPGYHYFGFRLKPGMFFSLDDFSLAEVADREISYSSFDVPLFGGFVERLSKLRRLDEMIGLFLPLYGGMFTDCWLTDSVKAIISRVNDTRGVATVAQLAHELCYSERQLARLMKSDTNISLKTFLRITRFQNALHNMIRAGGGTAGPAPSRPETLASCIAGLGYADQAHFSREFKEFTGISPRQFMKYYYQNRGRMRISE